ncbi:MAG: hypothetical protein KDJ52_03105 [Anaerolineae bacterium]|nr:hypothetical protein [Anaerolineae bacterium]
MDKNWMTELASHYSHLKQQYPDDKHLVLFDIDGTIFDMRYMVLYLLKKYDCVHQTSYFEALELSDITVHENDLMPLFDRFDVPAELRESLIEWYNTTAWTSEAMLEAHRPFQGVLEVIRWFQMQPETYVGLNTARPEKYRTDTLRSLNKLGQEYKVHFTNELLAMRESNDHKALAAKQAGIRYFQEQGYRVIAFIDNEPDNLRTVAEIDTDHTILLLHAETLFRGKRESLPNHAVVGTAYDLTALISKTALPKHIEFVWQSINNTPYMEQFLLSDVYWGEFDVRLNPFNGELILRGPSFQEQALQPEEDFLTLAHALDTLRYKNKGIKLDLKGGGRVIERIFDVALNYGFNGSKLWFSGHIDHLYEHDFKRLALAHPGATIQCPVDFLAPLVLHKPQRARKILERLTDWGVNRFSMDWRTANLRQLFEQMNVWGFELNLYNVRGLEAFLQAVLLQPRSIASDFDFSTWGYKSVGAENGHHHNGLRQIAKKVIASM